MRERSLPNLILAAWILVSTAQAAPPPGKPAVSLESPLSVRVEPQDVTLWGHRATQRFLVLGKFADGLERDLTSRGRFSVSDPEVASVEATGRVSALADGQTRLRVEAAGRTVHATIRVEGSGETRPFSFDRVIGGILTRKGCNDSGCHGSVKGRGGLKLSLNGLYPNQDYQWIVDGGVYQVLSPESGGPRVPRVNLQDPEKSLLLLKPTFSVPHGGGKRFAEDSLHYRRILNWVRKGAPYGEEGAVESSRIERLEVYPQWVVLDLQGTQQLLVTAHLSNGRREDLTGEVLYVSNDPGVVSVSPEGLVKAGKRGETAVMIRAAGHEVSAGFGVIAEPFADYPEVPRRNFIDGYVFAKLRQLAILPSELSSAEEFLRRVCLDLTGTLPPPGRVREFLADPDPEKRDKLIEILLDSPEYIDYWTFRFAELFRVSYENGGDAGIYPLLYWRWIREAIARNKPYDQVARERLAAQGYDGPTRHYFNGSDLRRPTDVMAEQVRVFLGRRLDCAQCHDHPYEAWSQNQFWGMTAFFGRVTQLGQLSHTPPGVVIDDPAGHGLYGEGEKVIHPRTKEEVPPRYLDGTLLAEDELSDPRTPLASWMTSHPHFAEAAVNRIWGNFFGRGIVDPVDDFRSSHQPTHPRLLKALARDFVEHGHDLKHLIRLIVRSRTYQLSSTPNQTNRDDRINYSRAWSRPLDAEVLLDAISQVAGVPEEFKNGTGMPMPPGTRALNLDRPHMFPSRFLDMYGRTDRQKVPERRVEANVEQGLHLLAGPTYTSKLSKQGGRIDRFLESGASDREVIEELSLAGRSRFPTPGEQAALERMIATRIEGGSSRRQALEALLWGLVASREFAYNH